MWLRNLASALVLGCLLVPVQAQAQPEFVGRIVLLPGGCQNGKQCTLGENFGYIDRNGIGWEADAGDVTDGASIPRWAQFFAGVPFEPSYLPAAILHDHYSRSVRPVRGWFETQRMFHEVLLANGVAPDQAALLYSGVLLGSGKWINRMKGKPCPTLAVCENSVGPIRPILTREAASFGTADHIETLARVSEQLAQLDELTAEEIERIVREERPFDIYLNTPSGVIGTLFVNGEAVITSDM